MCASRGDNSLTFPPLTNDALDQILMNRNSSTSIGGSRNAGISCPPSSNICGLGCMPQDATCCSTSGYCQYGYNCTFINSETNCVLARSSVNSKSDQPEYLPLSKIQPASSPISITTLVVIFSVGFALVSGSLFLVFYTRRKKVLKQGKIQEEAKKRKMEEAEKIQRHQRENSSSKDLSPSSESSNERGDMSTTDEEFPQPTGTPIILEGPPPIKIPGRPYLMYPKVIPILPSDHDPENPRASVIYARAIPIDTTTGQSITQSNSSVQLSERTSSYLFIPPPRSDHSSVSNEFSEYPKPMPDTNTIRTHARYAPILRGAVMHSTSAKQQQHNIFVAEDSDGDGDSILEMGSSSEPQPNKSVYPTPKFYVGDDTIDRANPTPKFFVRDDTMDRVSPIKSKTHIQNQLSYEANDSMDRSGNPEHHIIEKYSAFDSFDRAKNEIGSTTNNNVSMTYFADDSLSRDGILHRDQQFQYSPPQQSHEKLYEQPRPQQNLTRFFDSMEREFGSVFVDGEDSDSLSRNTGSSSQKSFPKQQQQAVPSKQVLYYGEDSLDRSGSYSQIPAQPQQPALYYGEDSLDRSGSFNQVPVQLPQAQMFEYYGEDSLDRPGQDNSFGYLSGESMDRPNPSNQSLHKPLDPPQFTYFGADSLDDVTMFPSTDVSPQQKQQPQTTPSSTTTTSNPNSPASKLDSFLSVQSFHYSLAGSSNPTDSIRFSNSSNESSTLTPQLLSILQNPPPTIEPEALMKRKLTNNIQRHIRFASTPASIISAHSYLSDTTTGDDLSSSASMGNWNDVSSGSNISFISNSRSPTPNSGGLGSYQPTSLLSYEMKVGGDGGEKVEFKYEAQDSDGESLDFRNSVTSVSVLSALDTMATIDEDVGVRRMGLGGNQMEFDAIDSDGSSIM
ncbi:hypothetical protein HK098_005445 [Nowakowskiella sp. JEL0407]|nr:hypothetical protein HK098_005445 [Nowakowskiella sp. JEL0407]